MKISNFIPRHYKVGAVALLLILGMGYFWYMDARKITRLEQDAKFYRNQYFLWKKYATGGPITSREKGNSMVTLDSKIRVGELIYKIPIMVKADIDRLLKPYAGAAIHVDETIGKAMDKPMKTAQGSPEKPEPSEDTPASEPTSGTGPEKPPLEPGHSATGDETVEAAVEAPSEDVEAPTEEETDSGVQDSEKPQE